MRLSRKSEFTHFNFAEALFDERSNVEASLDSAYVVDAGLGARMRRNEE